MTGDIKPSGSNMVEDCRKISRLVRASGLTVHGDSWSKSIWVFQIIPSTFKMLLCSATLCWDAVLWRSEQLEDREHKLNPALPSIDLDCMKYWIAASSLLQPETKLSTYKLWSISSAMELVYWERWNLRMELWGTGGSKKHYPKTVSDKRTKGITSVWQP